ncbi:DUF6461 domain-containing protein [Actinokineospora iranica]|uniref:Uncharacterized protein n=1 Tax=Actinokineospora iranica TaxID=1271860 RepID=A0A1G6T0D3_9PSEU|nr:DUF6461 domain-containing protein [Actinokineospora iranica]SDD22483.1 hypothetical protein SAMN05216174_108289 [Actinokineospora iranica]
MPQLSELVEKYAWAEPLARELVWCVSVVEGCDAGHVVRTFGGNPNASVGELTFREAEERVRSTAGEFGEFFLFQIFATGRHVVAIENNGYSGSIPEIARRASVKNGRYLSYFRNVNGDSTIIQAIGGKVTAYFEPLLTEGGPQVGEIHPDWIFGVDFQPGSARATCFALMEQETGLAFKPEWFEAKLPTYRIPDPYVLLKDVGDADTP